MLGLWRIGLAKHQAVQYLCLRSDGVDACIKFDENLTPRVKSPVDSNYDVRDPAPNPHQAPNLYNQGEKKKNQLWCQRPGPSPQPDTLLISHV